LGFTLDFLDGRDVVRLSSPCRIVGTAQPWIYLGPFATASRLALAKLKDLNQVQPAIGGDVYWRLDLPETWVRPTTKTPSMARGTIRSASRFYGLLHQRQGHRLDEIQQYVVNHIQSCCDTLGYASGTKPNTAAPPPCTRFLSSIDSLDDCGSSAP